MEAESRYTLVGAGVLLVLALLAIALVWLAGAADANDYQTYKIYFRHQSMEGLAVGSPVRMRGIKVGTVDSYRFANVNEEAVSMRVRIDDGVPVRTSAKAYVKRNLVTGLAAIEITNHDPHSPLLVAAAGERYPVISEGRSDLDKVTEAVSRLAENGAQVVERMNALLSDQNQQALAQTIENLHKLSGDLADDKHGVEAALNDIRRAADEVGRASDSVTRMAANADRSLQAIGKEASATLRQTSVAMQDLQRESIAISGRVQELAETSTLELTNISRDVRASADALTTAGRRLSDPRAVLFGVGRRQTGPGEEKP